MMRRRGLPSFCHGVASTSTVQQLHGKEPATSSSAAGVDATSSSFVTVPPSVVGSCVAETEASGTGGDDGGGGPAVTLEQMILQLDLEEEAARKARRAAAGEYGTSTEEDGWCPRRMSCCVDVGGGGGGPADHVLRSARDALSQYPRFSLDGRDAMYRASFSGFYDANHAAGNGNRPARASVCCAGGEAGCAALACSVGGYEYKMDLERTLRLPATVAGESVVWCKPGVVAKLMGLDAVPVPLRGGLRPRRKASGGHPAVAAACGVRKQRPRRTTTTGQDELALHKEKLFMALHGYDLVGIGGRRHAAWGLRSGVGTDVGTDGDGRESRLRC